VKEETLGPAFGGNDEEVKGLQVLHRKLLLDGDDRAL
jgi:hypothetical protein